MALFRSLKKKVKRDGIAQALELGGAAAVSVGVGLVYLPAGVIAAGVSVIAWALLIFDTEPRG